MKDQILRIISPYLDPIGVASGGDLRYLGIESDDCRKQMLRRTGLLGQMPHHIKVELFVENSSNTELGQEIPAIV